MHYLRMRVKPDNEMGTPSFGKWLDSGGSAFPDGAFEETWEEYERFNNNKIRKKAVEYFESTRWSSTEIIFKGLPDIEVIKFPHDKVTAASFHMIYRYLTGQLEAERSFYVEDENCFESIALIYFCLTIVFENLPKTRKFICSIGGNDPDLKIMSLKEDLDSVSNRMIGYWIGVDKEFENACKALPRGPSRRYKALS